MKKFVVLFSLFAAIAFAPAVFAQSNRGSVKTEKNGKANQRPVEVIESTESDVESESADEDLEQSDSNVENSGDIIKVDTKVVTVPVRVLDRKGRFVGGLTKENFQIFEDKIEQEIAFFSDQEQPFTVALVLDMSYSSKFKIKEIQRAAMDFVNELRPADKVLVIAFDGEVHVLSRPTNDRKVLGRAIYQTKIDSGTSLYDAVDWVINKEFSRIDGRKAIVLFTDGVDTSSEKSHDMKNLRDVLEADALIYPIRYDTYADVQKMKNQPIILQQPTIPSPLPQKNRSPLPFPLPTSTVGTPDTKGTTAEDYRRAEIYLNEMANRTGGTLYEANTFVDLARAFSKIAEELRTYYSIGFYPKNEETGKARRKLKVRVDRDKVAVRARDSYVVKDRNK